MGKKTQIHVQVDSETKARWKGYAEENPDIDNGSLSLLIRRAVRNEIEGRQRDNSGGGVASVDLSEVTEQQGQTQKEVAKLRDVVDSIDTQVEEVQRAVTSDTKRPLEERLWEVLPPAKPRSERWSRVREVHDVGAMQPRHWATAWSGELFEICRRVGETPDTVSEKLDEMGVPRDDIEGETRYWMEGQV